MAEVSLSTGEDRDLASAVIEHIEKNLKPNDVFTHAVLKAYVVDTWAPDEVFGDNALNDWAIEHGYVLPPSELL